MLIQTAIDESGSMASYFNTAEEFEKLMCGLSLDPMVQEVCNKSTTNVIFFTDGEPA